MFPILAIGAALLTGAGVAIAVSSRKGGSTPARSEESAAAAARPQSFLVTPVAGKYVESGQPLSMVDAVGKFIV